jgi:hypothetical protein
MASESRAVASGLLLRSAGESGLRDGNVAGDDEAAERTQLHLIIGTRLAFCREWLGEDPFLGNEYAHLFNASFRIPVERSLGAAYKFALRAAGSVLI